MKTKNITQIGMREFMRNTKVVKAKVAKGQSFEVLDHAVPVFHVVPPTPILRNAKYTLLDLAQFQFAGPTNLALTTDEIVYGQ